jgi:hypothetical protein
MLKKLALILGMHSETQLMMIFIGQGGTGKSHVLKAFKHFARGWDLQDKIRFSASSGVAASVIGGTTYHGLTKLNAKGVQHSKNKIIYANVDEISMLSLSFFGAGAKPNRNSCTSWWIGSCTLW